MLRLLLDEHISPRVAESLRRRHKSLVVYAMTQWEEGRFLGQDDSVCLLHAAKQKLTFVTYDRRTNPLLLKAWAEEARAHAGVIFVDEKTISPANIGGLVNALSSLCQNSPNQNWSNLIYFLQR